MSWAENRIHVELSPEHAFQRWRDPAWLSRFLAGVQSVTERAGGVTHWVMEIDGRVEEWDTTVEEDPGRRIAWRDTEGRHVREVTFTPGDDDEAGTWVNLRIEYSPALRHVSATGLAVTARSVADDLWRFKVLVEEGPQALQRAVDVEEREGPADDYVVTGRRFDVERLPGETVPSVLDARRPDAREAREEDPADFDDNAAQFSREPYSPDNRRRSDWST